MFVFNFGGSSLEQSVNLGRLVIFDSLGNSLNTTFSKTTAKENLLKTPAIVLLANFQILARHPRLAFDWLSVSFFDY